MNVIFNISILINIEIILLLCSYYDLKSRIIPKWIIFYFFFSGLITTFIDFIFFKQFTTKFLFLKGIVLFLSFLFSFLLFFFKIIGGGDGKLMMLIFLSSPFFYTSLFDVYLFYLFFIIGFFIMILLNIIFLKNNLYNYFFHIIKINSWSKKLYFYAFYRFLDFTKISVASYSKYYIKSEFLFYNPKRDKFQFFIQLRPPLALIILFGFNSWYLIQIFYSYYLI
jgi:Flp pilus assembly protein protease CpaA